MTRNHIVPINDLKDHYTRSSECWCEPVIDKELVIHNAADGREFIEEEEREMILQGMREAAAGQVVRLEDVRREIVGAH